MSSLRFGFIVAIAVSALQIGAMHSHAAVHHTTVAISQASSAPMK